MTSQEQKTACVTGGNGFIASTVIKQLLEKGYAVNVTVRDPGFLYADLSEEGSFDAAMSGCHYVFLVAAPVNMAAEDAEGYAVSKVLAEKEASKFALENGIDLVTMIPSLAIGPALGAELNLSLMLGVSLLSGLTSLLRRLNRLPAATSAAPSTRVCRSLPSSSQNDTLGTRSLQSKQYSAVTAIKKRTLEIQLLTVWWHEINRSFSDLPEKPKLMLSSEKLVKAGFEFKYKQLEDIYDETVQFAEAVGLLQPKSKGSA
ncbi:hypothetical protein BHM03_00047534 [Ensete ventricosum]|nr:hypothetical protein BHM03_00047534 [Ensete ventricosum]